MSRLEQVIEKYELYDWVKYYSDLPYHNAEHILGFDFESAPSDEAIIAALLHDASYKPVLEAGDVTNEHRAALAVINFSKLDPIRDYVQMLIMSTQDHVASFDPDNKDIVWLHSNDLRYFIEDTPINHIINNERKIFKEYPSIPFRVVGKSCFVSNRIKVLEHFSNHKLVNVKTICRIIEYLRSWVPHVGVYCGSFNPFHAGHADVLTRAEQYFDKVIIAVGHNPEKGGAFTPLSKQVGSKYKHYQTIYFDDVVHLHKNITRGQNIRMSFIRGIRNAHDLHDEMQYQHYVKELTGCDFINIITSLEHIFTSSGAIRSIEKINTPESTALSIKVRRGNKIVPFRDAA